MMIVASALTVALLCLAPGTSHAFVSNQNNNGGVTSRGEPLASLVMDRTDVFRPASTHPRTYLPGAPSSSLGIGYGVSSYGPSYGYGYGYGYNSDDYDRYNRYGKYSTYDNTRSINDRTYNYNNNYNYNYYSPNRYGSTYGSNSWNSGNRRINYAGSNYYGGRSTWDSDVYGSGRNYYNSNNYNTGYYNNNNYYNNRYNSYNSDPWYSGSSYGNNRYTSGYSNNNHYGPYNSDYYRSGSYNGANGYNNYGNYNNWNSLSRNNYYGRSSNWATGNGYDLDIDRRGAFEAGSTYSTYNRPSRTALQLQGYGYGSNGYNWSSDQPRAFNPGYNWRK